VKRLAPEATEALDKPDFQEKIRAEAQKNVEEKLDQKDLTQFAADMKECLKEETDRKDPATVFNIYFKNWTWRLHGLGKKNKEDGATLSKYSGEKAAIALGKAFEKFAYWEVTRQMAEKAGTLRKERKSLGTGPAVSPEEIAEKFLEKRKGDMVEDVPDDKKSEFSEALKEMEFVKYLLKQYGEKQPLKPGDVPTGEADKHWKGGGSVADNIDMSQKLVNEKGNKWGIPIKTHWPNKFKRQLKEAEKFVLTAVEQHLLDNIPKPTVFVHFKYTHDFWGKWNFYRANQKGDEVHVAQGENVSVMAHEIGHYIEANLPSETWHDIQLLLRERHTVNRLEKVKEAKQKKKERLWKRKGRIGHGPNWSEEGRYRGDYKATGKYTSSAYKSGDTEVMSMTFEFLSNPKKAEAMIDKDPLQAAIILRGIRPKDYQATTRLEPFNFFLPTKDDVES